MEAAFKGQILVIEIVFIPTSPSIPPWLFWGSHRLIRSKLVRKVLTPLPSHQKIHCILRSTSALHPNLHSIPWPRAFGRSLFTSMHKSGNRLSRCLGWSLRGSSHCCRLLRAQCVGMDIDMKVVILLMAVWRPLKPQGNWTIDEAHTAAHPALRSNFRCAFYSSNARMVKFWNIYVRRNQRKWYMFYGYWNPI